MFDIFINELFENGPVIRVPEQTIILKYFDLGLKIHSSEPFRCLTQSKDVKCFLKNSTAHFLQIRKLGVESHCHLSHKICLIKCINGIMEGQHMNLF